MRAGLLAALLLTACSGSAATTPTVSEECADIVSVEVTAMTDATHRFDVTVASADTGWDKYADAWEIRDERGSVLATRALTHPHVEEQPFTRSLSGVVIPAGVETVQVAARDSVEGFCGATLTIPIP